MLTKQDLISIVIPTLNEEEHIEKLLRSIYEQEYRPLEVVVVDDGSTDTTKQIVKKFCAETTDSDFNLYLTETGTFGKKGAAFARNLGIKKSNGKYILLIDADCLLSKKTIITELTQELQYNPIVGFRDVVLIDNWLEQNQMLDAGDPPYATPAKWSHLAFTREILEQFPFDPQLGVGEDADFLLRLKNAAKLNVTTIDTTGCIHLPHTLKEYGQQGFWVGKTRWLFLKKHPNNKAKLATIARATPALILIATAITAFINYLPALILASSWLALVIYYYANSPNKKPERIAYLFLKFTYNSFSYTLGLLKGYMDLRIKGVINPSRGK